MSKKMRDAVNDKVSLALKATGVATAACTIGLKFYLESCCAEASKNSWCDETGSVSFTSLLPTTLVLGTAVFCLATKCIVDNSEKQR